MKKVILLIIVCSACLYAGLALGSRCLSPVSLWNLFSGAPETEKLIFFQVRLPRVLAGFFIGGGLAASGSVFQALLRNPLADSYTLGISGGALLGVCAGILLGRFMAIPGCAFAGALISLAIILLAGARRRFSNATLVLLGVVLNFIFSSFVLFLLAMVRSEKFQATFFWLVGDLSFYPENLLVPGILFITVFSIILMAFGGVLDLLSVSEEKAQTLGVSTELMKMNILVVASLVVAFCVSLGGMIGFVGLIVPHAVRMMLGASHRKVVPGGFLLGGSFLVFCDGLARTLIRPLEMPVGVITGFLGGIFFLILLLRSKTQELW
jgi:iron complex transport system permease protein